MEALKSEMAQQKPPFDLLIQIGPDGVNALEQLVKEKMEKQGELQSRISRPTLFNSPWKWSAIWLLLPPAWLSQHIDQGLVVGQIAHIQQSSPILSPSQD